MILYLDCSSGISGDMLVAALLSLSGATEKKPGALDEVVRSALAAAGIDRRLVSIRATRRGDVEALSFRVPEGTGFATFDELIVSMYASGLDQAVADTVAGLAQRMAAAEREVHGERVHEKLDELGGLDTAVDLISAVAMMRHLAPERVVASPPALGGGTIDTAHGELEVPAPAVAALLRGVPTAPLDPTGKLGELTTPTGAALLTQFVQEFGPAPEGPVLAAGAGAGTRELPGRPNVLRALFIETAPQEEPMDEDTDAGRPGGEDTGEGRTEDKPSESALRRTLTGIAGGARRRRAKAAEAADTDAAETPAGLAATDERAPAVAAPAAEAAKAEAEPSAPDEGAAKAAEAAGAAAPAAVTETEEEAPAEEPVEKEETQAMTDDQVKLDHVVLEATIDDMAPELLAHAAEVLREAGALDVWMTQALMKKGRPGVVLHVLAGAAAQRDLAGVMFAETTTFGLRVVPVGRLYAEERRETVKLGGHEIHVRLSMVDGRPATVSPEYEDCRQAAEALNRPAKVVYEAAQAAARARFSGA